MQILFVNVCFQQALFILCFFNIFNRVTTERVKLAKIIAKQTEGGT